jgi:hypothetical protein
MSALPVSAEERQRRAQLARPLSSFEPLHETTDGVEGNHIQTQTSGTHPATFTVLIPFRNEIEGHALSVIWQHT